MRDHYLYLLCSLTLTYLFALQSLDYVHFITDSSTYILTLYSTAQLDQRFLRSMNSFHIQEHHLHSISALLCLKTRDLFAVSISKSSLTCTIAQLHCCLHSFTFCVCIEVLCTALLYTASLCTVLLCTTSLCTALLCTLDSVHCVWCL